MIMENSHFVHFFKLENIEPGVDSNRLLDDKTILDELADVLARVGVGDLVNLIGVQPDLKKRSWDWECEIDNNSKSLPAASKRSPSQRPRTLFLPHFMTPAARRFCSLRELIAAIDDFSETLQIENLAI